MNVLIIIDGGSRHSNDNQEYKPKKLLLTYV